MLWQSCSSWSRACRHLRQLPRLAHASNAISNRHFTTRSRTSRATTTNSGELPPNLKHFAIAASLTAVALGCGKGLRDNMEKSAGVHCEALLPPQKAVISRLMLPDDANPAGNVHGGTILSMIDEAGWAAATKYMNQSSSAERPSAVASLARIEHVDFFKPMYIGEMSRVEAEVTFSSAHSIEVFAENILTGHTRLTNCARSWYVAKPFKKEETVNNHLLEKFSGKSTASNVLQLPALEVPPLCYPSDKNYEEGLNRYETQRQLRLDRETANKEHPFVPEHATLIHVLHPSDCFSNGIAQAGVVMKLMDTAAGVVSVRHCRSNVVTASLEAVDFLIPVTNGDLLEIHAQPVFNSSRSMDIEVNVYMQALNSSEKTLAATSIFTFVALDQDYRPREVPPISVSTDAARARFEAGKKRYEQRKALRKAQKKPAELEDTQKA